MKPFGVIAIDSRNRGWSFLINRDGTPHGFRETRARRNPLRFLDERGGVAEPEPDMPEEDNEIEVFTDGAQYETDGEEINQLSEDQVVWFVNTQKDADDLAAVLAKKNPTNKYMTFRTASLFYAPPGEIQRAEFSDKGLLPS